MPDSIDSPQEALTVTITDAASTGSDVEPTIAGGSDSTSALDNALAENALIFSEIDRMLTTASAMAHYYERSSVRDAIILALRINRMDYEGRRFELTRRGEQF